MPDLSVKKVKTSSSQIAGLKTSRYEKLGVAYGTVETADYTLGDTLVFDDVNSFDIVHATIVGHTATPTILEIYPGTDTTNPIAMELNGAAGTKSRISYIITYIRGTGRVGSTTDVGEGRVLRVTVNNSVA